MQVTHRRWDYEKKKMLFVLYLRAQNLASVAEALNMSVSHLNHLLNTMVKELALSWVRSAYHMKVAEAKDLHIQRFFEFLGSNKREWIDNSQFMLEQLRRVEIAADVTGKPLLEDTYNKKHQTLTYSIQALRH